MQRFFLASKSLTLSPEDDLREKKGDEKLRMGSVDHVEKNRSKHLKLSLFHRETICYCGSCHGLLPMFSAVSVNLASNRCRTCRISLPRARSMSRTSSASLAALASAIRTSARRDTIPIEPRRPRHLNLSMRAVRRCRHPGHKRS